jgi:transcriptional regulator with XRE-family HTH domain
MITEIGEQIIKLRSEGLSLNKIATRLSCSKSTVSKYCGVLHDNQAIIVANTAAVLSYRIKQQQQRRSVELLRNKKPDDPTWFSNYKARLREAVRAFLLSAVESKCQVCGYSRCSSNLAFHHKDQTTKEFGLSGMRLTYNLDRIINEARKCVVLCHNCHGEAHAGILDIDAIPAVQFEETPDNVISWWIENCCE